MRLLISTMFCVFGIGMAAMLLGTTLPESYPVEGAKPDEPNPVEENLDVWKEHHVDRPDLTEISDAEFQKEVGKVDRFTAVTMQLSRLNRITADDKKLNAEQEEFRNKVRDTLYEASLKENLIKGAPLTAWTWLELWRSMPEDDLERRAKLSNLIERQAAGSCAHKRLMIEDINESSIATASENDLLNMLARVETFKSGRFKRIVSQRVIEHLPESHRAALGPKLVSILKPWPWVINDTKWLDAIDDQIVVEKAEPARSFSEAESQARRRRCDTAKARFLTGLSRIKRKSDLEDTIDTARTIGSCYRRRGASRRRGFWKAIETPMANTFGFIGWAEVRSRYGSLLWSADKFEEAEKVFNDMAARSLKAKQSKYAAEAVFTLGRIAENKGDLDRAVYYYDQYIEKYSDYEHREKALMAIVLLYADRGDWKSAEKPLVKIINEQNKLKMDERGVGELTFAYFWAGRIFLEQGRRELATEMWRRLATEYYSTYYGAMGHYMLEQVTGRTIALHPTRTGEFRLNRWRQAFHPKDQTRIERAEVFLRLGMTDQASCEMAEVDLTDNKPEKQLVRALYNHASGDWLDAIKTFGNLPRTFRASLPVGFERILFPRRYVDEIKAYAAKAKVDPYFVMAVIRQESVFNPVAKSPAGALGLMQLMPATARLESRRLSRSYLPANDRARLKRLAKRRANVLEADTNLALGTHHIKTLFEKYRSPVYVLCAYNASPNALQKWQKNIPTHDLLTFIERIPYKETRAYAKLVLRNYFYYKRWYGSPSENLSHLEAVTARLTSMASASSKQGGAKKIQ